MQRNSLAVFVLWGVVSVAHAQSANLESAELQTRLLELYTSEGCSSCPPADRWLSTLEEDDRLWGQIVPVAFHVDYWDYIGWQDRFATPAYGNRQRSYARAGNVKTVYTPGFVLNGDEWRAWFRNKSLPEHQPVRVGKLAVDVRDGSGSAKFSPTEARKDVELTLHLALLGFDLETQVEAGENRGRVLHHDFAVLAYDTLPMPRTGELYAADVSVPRSDEPTAKRGLAVWVTERGSVDPIQSTGGWLDL